MLNLALDAGREHDGFGDAALEDEVGGRPAGREDGAGEVAGILDAEASWTWVMPTVTVMLVIGVTTRNGHRKLFQAPMKVMMASAVVTPQFIGRKMRKKIWNSLAPSISAASRNSFGI